MVRNLSWAHDMGLLKDDHRMEIGTILNGVVDFDYPMSKLATAGVGGEVAALCRVRHLSMLKHLVAFLSGEHIPYLAVGKGSNILVTDEGFGGVVIVLEGKLSEVEGLEQGKDSLRAGGGLALGGLLSYCRDKGLGGLEFLAGIPGTVGGAIAMNAGAFGSEIGPLVREISVVVPGGETKTMRAPELKFSYRSLSLPGGTVIAQALIGVRKDEPERIGSRISENLARRKKTQPVEYPSCGSVFKNPPGDFAGRLIEQAGLKGSRVGGAMISPKHANFIVNTGGATAKDFVQLMDLARREVRKRIGVELDPEIRIIG
ncbi:MAG: UDP-N-acetylmuramate dehydrogenase [Deltaproteobacteria bacterium]|nr:UDP-N-acetylmuramate dehydrogenase [Deltaproteobacteria bacterium]